MKIIHLTEGKDEKYLRILKSTLLRNKIKGKVLNSGNKSFYVDGQHLKIVMPKDNFTDSDFLAIDVLVLVGHEDFKCNTPKYEYHRIRIFKHSTNEENTIQRISSLLPNESNDREEHFEGNGEQIYI